MCLLVNESNWHCRPVAVHRRHDFEARKLSLVQAAFEARGIAAKARRGYFGAVAAQELVKYYHQVKEAADASNELAKRLRRPPT